VLSQFVFLLKIQINNTFTLLFYKRFPSSLSITLDTQVIVYWMCRPSQTPCQIMSFLQISERQRSHSSAWATRPLAQKTAGLEALKQTREDGSDCSAYPQLFSLLWRVVTITAWNKWQHLFCMKIK